MSALVHCEVTHGIAEIVFNRPEKKNALTLEMYEQATEHLRHAATDPEVHVVMFRGAGESFCAGNDLKDFAAALHSPDILKTIVTFLHEVAAFEKPLIAAVQGDAVGLGTTIMLHCDLVIAADDLKCQMPFVRLGLVPEAGSTLLIPNMLGHRRAFELLVEGQPFGAEKAYDSGLVNTISPLSDYLSVARSRAAYLAQLPQTAVVTSKRCLKQDYLKKLHEVIDAEVELFAERLQSDEAQKQFMAFLQKA